MRKIEHTDAPELSRLIQAIWPDHNLSPERIARVILENNHATYAQTDGERLVGFVDGFATAAQDGTVRWEIDLLGVLPEYRGGGIATDLVRVVTEAGREFGAASMRALVKVGNAASENTFLRCGFTLEPQVYDLCISDCAVDEGKLPSVQGAHLVPVATLTYGGVWIEGTQTAENLRAGQAVRTRYGWDVAGAVILAGLHDADAVGFEAVGQYRWLRR